MHLLSHACNNDHLQHLSVSHCTVHNNFIYSFYNTFSKTFNHWLFHNYHYKYPFTYIAVFTIFQ